MYVLRLISYSALVLGFCGCAAINFDFNDHLKVPTYNRVEPPAGVKVQKVRGIRKVHRVYTREQLDVRLDAALATLQESGIKTMHGGMYNVKNLLNKLFTNNTESKYLLKFRESDLNYLYSALNPNGYAGYIGTYNLIVTLTNGDETEIIRVEKTAFAASSPESAKAAIEQVLDELYMVVSIQLENWEGR
jgi:hypothetical protein